MFKSSSDAAEFIVETLAPSATSFMRIVHAGEMRLNLRIFPAPVVSNTAPAGQGLRRLFGR